MQVAFYKGRSRLFNRLVCWWTRSNYSHCELILGETELGSLCASSSFLDEGVRFKVIPLKPEHWDVVEVSLDATGAREWFNLKQGLRYDTAGIFGFVIRRYPQCRNRWFCSEAVAEALGFPDSWRFDPGTLAAALRRIG